MTAQLAAVLMIIMAVVAHSEPRAVAVPMRPAVTFAQHWTTKVAVEAWKRPLIDAVQRLGLNTLKSVALQNLFQPSNDVFANHPESFAFLLEALENNGTTPEDFVTFTLTNQRMTLLRAAKIAERNAEMLASEATAVYRQQRAAEQVWHLTKETYPHFFALINQAREMAPYLDASSAVILGQAAEVVEKYGGNDATSSRIAAEQYPALVGQYLEARFIAQDLPKLLSREAFEKEVQALSLSPSIGLWTLRKAAHLRGALKRPEILALLDDNHAALLDANLQSLTYDEPALVLAHEAFLQYALTEDNLDAIHAYFRYYLDRAQKNSAQIRERIKHYLNAEDSPISWAKVDKKGREIVAQINSFSEHAFPIFIGLLAGALVGAALAWIFDISPLWGIPFIIWAGISLPYYLLRPVRRRAQVLMDEGKTIGERMRGI